MGSCIQAAAGKLSAIQSAHRQHRILNSSSTEWPEPAARRHVGNMQPSGYPGGPLPGLSDFFSVELLNPQTGHALPSIDYDGSRVFVGEPGQEFTVAVSMSNYTGSDYKISLRVDGNDPGYSLVYYGTNRAYKSVFQGWLHQSGAVSGPCSTTYRLFRLNACKPSQAAATADSVDELAAGRVEVLIDQVVNTGRCQQSLNVKPAAPSSAAADKKLPEGKKVGAVGSVVSAWFGCLAPRQLTVNLLAVEPLNCAIWPASKPCAERDARVLLLCVLLVCSGSWRQVSR